MHIYILCTLTRTISYKNTLVFETLLNAEQLALKPIVQIVVLSYENVVNCYLKTTY